MQPPEIIHVETATVGCDGGGGPLGHPLVYLPIGVSGQTDCPYCGRRFIQDHAGHDHAGQDHGAAARTGKAQDHV